MADDDRSRQSRDGILATAWAVGGGRRLEGWPVLLEGILSSGLGVTAPGYPVQSSGFLQSVALWGLATGVLEIVGAVRCVRGVAAPSCLPDLVMIVGVYALVFGILVSTVAFTLRRRLIFPVLVAPVNDTWTVR